MKYDFWILAILIDYEWQLIILIIDVNFSWEIIKKFDCLK